MDTQRCYCCMWIVCRFSLLLAVQIATLPQMGHRLLSNATLQHLIINTDKFKHSFDTFPVVASADIENFKRWWVEPLVFPICSPVGKWLLLELYLPQLDCKLDCKKTLEMIAGCQAQPSMWEFFTSQLKELKTRGGLVTCQTGGCMPNNSQKTLGWLHFGARTVTPRQHIRVEF